MADIMNIWPRWKVEGQLDSGDYAKTYKAVCREHNTELYAAIKVISISSKTFGIDPTNFSGLDGDYARSQMQKTADEFTGGLKSLNYLKGHPGIVSVDDYKVVEKPNELLWEIYVRMELLTPFDSYVRQTRITEEAVIRFGQDMCDAIEVCRKNGIAYCDIVPENIFVDKTGHFKLGNFGVERKLGDLSGGITSKGTPGHSGVEKESSSVQSEQAKIYALGMIMYRLLNGNVLPFSDNSNTYTTLSRKSLPAPSNASLSMSDVILKACSSSYANAAELKQALADVTNGVYRRASTSSFNSSQTAQRPSTPYQQRTPAKKTPPAKRKSPAVAVVAVAAVLLVLIIAGLSMSLIGNLSKERPADENVNHINAADDSVNDSDTADDNVNHSDTADDNVNDNDAANPDNMQDESNVTVQGDQQNDDSVLPENDPQVEEASEPDEAQNNVQSEDKYMYLTDLTCSDSSDDDAFIHYAAVMDNLGTRYSNGIGGSDGYGQCWQEYKLSGEYTELRGRVVLNYEVRTQTNSNMYIWIYGDDTQLYKSKEIKGGTLPQDFVVDITGVETLRIVIEGKSMIRLVDCALYTNSSVKTVSTAKKSDDNKQSQVNLGELDWFNASEKDGAYNYQPNAVDRNNKKYSGALIGSVDREIWQEYYIGGKYSEMSGKIVRPWSSGIIWDSSPAVMKVYGDGVLLYQTQIFDNSGTIKFDIDISGVQVLVVYTTYSRHFMIADCVLTKQGGQQGDAGVVSDEKLNNVQSDSKYIYLKDLTCSDSSDDDAFVYYIAVMDNLGTRYSNGIGGSDGYGQCWQEYKLSGEYTELRGRVVLNYEVRTQTNSDVYLWIYGDDTLLYKSKEIKGGVMPQDFVVDVTGVKTLKIVIQGQSMVRLVDCALYKNSSVKTVSTAKEADDNKETQVNLGELDWFNSSQADGAYNYQPNVVDRNGKEYSGVLIGSVDKEVWQDYYIDGSYTEMSGKIVHPRSSGIIWDSSPAVMKVYGDGVLLYQTEIYDNSGTIKFNIDISGVRVLRVYTTYSRRLMIADCVLTK